MFLALETVQMLKGSMQNYLSKLLNVKILKTNYTMNTGMSTALISGLVSHTTKQSLYCLTYVSSTYQLLWRNLFLLAKANL